MGLVYTQTHTNTRLYFHTGTEGDKQGASTGLRQHGAFLGRFHSELAPGDGFLFLLLDFRSRTLHWSLVRNEYCNR